MKSSNASADDECLFTDKLREECGVFGVFLDDPEKDAVLLAYYGLLALQHRGQESAGIAASKNNIIDFRKNTGLVNEVFAGNVLGELKGSSAIGHVRYSTSGNSAVINAQPFVNHFKQDSFAVVHNGALTNADVVRELLEDVGIGFSSSSDSEIIVNLIAKNYKKGMEKALADTLQFIRGSYSMLVLAGDVLVGARDPGGIRPLCLGKLDGGWILASESCAIDAAGGEFVRDVDGGEVVIISRDGIKSFNYSEKNRKTICAFEYVYFARPDSIIDKVDVYNARVRAGEILGRECKADADLVIGVPDSGIPAAIGYGHTANTRFGLGIVKSKYVARTFIFPNQIQREKAVVVKHNVITSEVKNKRVVLIDDSIVRGTTMRRLVGIIRNAGAKEVHLRISSPPVKFPCYFGIDTPHRKDLISNCSSIDELCRSLGADSLAFISESGLLEAIDGPGENGYCLSCFSGVYPIPVPGEKSIDLEF